MAAPDFVKRGKTSLGVTMLLIGALMLFGPQGLSRLGVIGQLKHSAVIVLLVAFIGIVAKAAMSFLITNDFRFDKFAYELCVLVLGGTLTCFSLQITATSDQFSGLGSITFLQSVAATFSNDTRSQHLVLIFGLLVFAGLAMLFAAINVRDIENGTTSWPWTLLMFGIGIGSLSFYTLLLVART